ncbi:MAG TPA: alpha/beta hydrolase [Acidimicrobiales bacterium]|nr:alpha/beta hydrolase [Acidimicrobiales bacterium]
MDQGTVIANGVRFAFLEEGPDDGPLALCLHGFPDTAHTWRHLLPVLGEAGFHAVAPWARGYAPSEVPADGRYQTGALAVDACALHEAFRGDGRAVLVGHDWGAMTTYAAAAHRPDLWRRAVTMNVPPFGSLAAGFLSYSQLKRSFYVFVFQTPLAEAVVAADDFAFIDQLWADWSTGYDATWDLARVKEAISGPENLAAAIGAYRTMFDPTLHDPAYADAQSALMKTAPQPFLYLHGTADGCVDIGVIGDPLGFLGPGSQFVKIEGAGHFLQLEQPTVVNELVLEFLTD